MTSISTMPCGTPAMRCRSTKTGRISHASNGVATSNVVHHGRTAIQTGSIKSGSPALHSDIGGSYAENESRYPISLLSGWFMQPDNLPDEKTPNGNGIKVDRTYLRLNPDPCGPQHDAREPGWFGGRLRWAKALRKIDPDAPLHQSVYARFGADKVQHFYEMKPYRPENLATHKNLQQYYPANAKSGRKSSRSLSAKPF